jgi:hypothetical protein
MTGSKKIRSPFIFAQLINYLTSLVFPLIASQFIDKRSADTLIVKYFLSNTTSYTKIALHKDL